MSNLLSVRDLRVTLQSDGAKTAIVRGVSLEISKGDFCCLVGESGCGKSVTAMSITRLPPADDADCGGEILFRGADVLAMDRAQLRGVRGNSGISYIFQDPMSALNPVLSIGTQMREALPRDMTRKQGESRMVELLGLVGLAGDAGTSILKTYPCQLSGGMAQRVCIAMAMASDPALLIADEPSTALDVITQRQVLELLDGIRRETATSIFLITHNLGLVARYGTSMYVMYAGKIVESGSVRDVISQPRHPYTRGLLAAVPGLAGGSVEELATIPGRVPSPSEWGGGCTFAPRCSLAMPVCLATSPALLADADGHATACHAVNPPS